MTVIFSQNPDILMDMSDNTKHKDSSEKKWSPSKICGEELKPSAKQIVQENMCISNNISAAFTADTIKVKTERVTTNEIEISKLSEVNKHEIIDVISDEEEDHAKILARVIATYAPPNYVFPGFDKLKKLQEPNKMLETLTSQDSHKIKNTLENDKKCNMFSKNEKNVNSFSENNDHKICNITCDKKEDHNLLLPQLHVAKSVIDSASPKFQYKRIPIESINNISNICFSPRSPQLVFAEDNASNTNMAISPLRVLSLRNRKIHVSPSPKKVVQRGRKTKGNKDFIQT